MAESTESSLWTDCAVVIDEPLKIPLLGIEFDFDDFLFGGIVSIVLLIVLPPMWWAGVTGALLLVLHYGKRGKPRGALWQWCHAMELWRIPGVLSPREEIYDYW
jgi:hypothetical protein